ncbi:hypothetical protein SISSUDRAFT_1035247 [Sistotremastrum suecicum HHB10207 ss-3]|uniref:Uncharacterized protein n=1 Tax=Sistotremastrum suecicum HHB10207 ss-3 TaxID=1314776 RepID=A0A166AZV7_9AGAM|nr:hypothetical protein SISSUDRAFT_1035247 [Sistotremastrum suecicum HHB10207 ss-3]
MAPLGAYGAALSFAVPIPIFLPILRADMDIGFVMDQAILSDPEVARENRYDADVAKVHHSLRQHFVWQYGFIYLGAYFSINAGTAIQSRSGSMSYSLSGSSDFGD